MRILFIHSYSNDQDAIFKQSLLLPDDISSYSHATITTNTKLSSEELSLANPDIIIFDRVSEPYGDEDPLLIKKIKEHFKSLPILLIISGHTDAAYREKMLDAGADSIATSPFSRDEILLRINKLYKKRENLLFQGTEVAVGDISIDIKDHTITAGDKSVSLTKTEYILFTHLLINHKRSVPGKELLSYMEEKESTGTKALNVHILNIRKKLEPYSVIKTIHHYGYSIVS